MGSKPVTVDVNLFLRKERELQRLQIALQQTEARSDVGAGPCVHTLYGAGGMATLDEEKSWHWLIAHSSEPLNHSPDLGEKSKYVIKHLHRRVEIVYTIPYCGSKWVKMGRTPRFS